MPTISGRAREQLHLRRVLDSPRAEFVAIYGRRRIGKTYLVRNVMAPSAEIYFEIVGHKGAPMATQLFHFMQSLQRAFGGTPPTPKSWDGAFGALVEQLERHRAARSIVLFFDELPWLATRRSGLLQALDYHWNARISQLANVRLIACGSAASWIIDKLIGARGGLHNRITRQIALQPFTLPEMRTFLADLGSSMGLHQALTLYMAVGGVPLYLEQVDPAHSAIQAIDALCFAPQGLLREEFGRLFSSLFSDGPLYEKIVRVIASKRSGVLRSALVEALGKQSGGTLNQRLLDLEQAGFIARITPYNQQKRDMAFRIVDPYVFFYLKWIDSAPAGIFADRGSEHWLSQVGTPAWHAWSGYAFETLCMQHAGLIKTALGIDGIASQVGSWHYFPAPGQRESRGAQIDLLFDRADGVVTLCELKHTDRAFVVTKAYARQLAHKIRVFETQTRTRKDVQLALITTHGLRRNIWTEELVTQDLAAADIFAPAPRYATQPRGRSGGARLSQSDE